MTLDMTLSLSLSLSLLCLWQSDWNSDRNSKVDEKQADSFRAGVRSREFSKKWPRDWHVQDGFSFAPWDSGEDSAEPGRPDAPTQGQAGLQPVEPANQQPPILDQVCTEAQVRQQDIFASFFYPAVFFYYFFLSTLCSLVPPAVMPILWRHGWQPLEQEDAPTPNRAQDDNDIDPVPVTKAKMPPRPVLGFALDERNPFVYNMVKNCCGEEAIGSTWQVRITHNSFSSYFNTKWCCVQAVSGDDWTVLPWDFEEVGTIGPPPVPEVMIIHDHLHNWKCC